MLLGTHYRAAINYTARALDEASDRMFYIYQTLADADAAVRGAAPGGALPKTLPPQVADALAAAEALPGAVDAALADDVNTPQARGRLGQTVRSLVRWIK